MLTAGQHLVLLLDCLFSW